MGFAAGMRQTPINNYTLWCFVNGASGCIFREKHSKNLHRQACPHDEESLMEMLRSFSRCTIEATSAITFKVIHCPFPIFE